jgi:hypothetical protein
VAASTSWRAWGFEQRAVQVDLHSQAFAANMAQQQHASAHSGIFIVLLNAMRPNNFATTHVK